MLVESMRWLVRFCVSMIASVGGVMSNGTISEMSPR